MIALAFFLSCLFSSSRTAVVFCFLIVFGSGLTGQWVMRRYIISGYDKLWLFKLIPSLGLYRYAALHWQGLRHRENMSRGLQISIFSWLCANASAGTASQECWESYPAFGFECP